MANVDNPNGFRAVRTLNGSCIPILPKYGKANTNFNVGDAVIIGAADGLIDVALPSSTAIYGVCVCKSVAEAGVSKEIQFVPASKDIIFEGQCSGTYAVTYDGDYVDIEGTTGIMEINENSSTYGVAQIVCMAPAPDNAVGANARVHFKWAASSFEA